MRGSRQLSRLNCVYIQPKRRILRREPQRWHNQQATGNTTKSTAPQNTQPVAAEESSSSSSWITPKSFGIGSAAGIMGSLAGMGGGFVMIPLMTSGMLRLSQHQAHGTSLAAVMATGCAGAVAYQEHVDLEAAAAIAATAIVTATAGARVTQHLSGKALTRALGVLLVVMGPAVPAKKYFLQWHEQKQAEKEEERKKFPKLSRKNTTSLSSPFEEKQASRWERLMAPAAIGLGSGFLAGLFGVGGGAIVVPALLFTSQDQDNSYNHHQALATSLAAMTLPAAVGTMTHATAGNVAFRVAPPLALGALCGAYFGGKLAVQTNETTLQWGFSILLTVLGVKTLRKTF